MTTKKLLNWFLTDQGKQFSYYAAGTAITGTMLANYVSQTILVDKYKDIFLLYKKGSPVPVSANLQKRFEKAMDLLEIDQEDRKLYSCFMAYGFDIFSLGTDSSRFGVKVGIPSNFQYDRPEQVEKPNILLNQANRKHIDWSSKEGQQLVDALVLSEKAQLYAIAKEIKFRQSPKVFIDTIVATTCAAATYLLSNFINQKFDLYSKPRSMRIFIYTFSSILFFTNYLMCKDMSQIYFEKTADDYLVSKNPVFIEGGKEFYEKILQRNIALRTLLGDKGEKIYTVMGNENNILRTKHLPLVERKLYFTGKALGS